MRISSPYATGGRLTIAGLLAGALLGLTAAAAAQGAAAPRSTPAPAPAASGDIVGSTDFGRPDFARTLWWHHRRNTSRFAVTDRQIAALDRLLAPRLAEFERLARANEQSQRSYLAAIAGAQWDAAHAAAIVRADTFGKLQGAQFALQIEGLKLLDAAQRDRLARELPRLVQSGWIRASALAGGAGAHAAPASDAEPSGTP